MLLNPFCLLTTAKVLALKATVLVLLALLLKAKVQITTFSALGFFLLLLQTLVFVAGGGGCHRYRTWHPWGLRSGPASCMVETT